MTRNSEQFRLFFLASIVLHLLIIYFFIFGIGFKMTKPEPDRVVIFDVLPISNISNVINQTKQVKEKNIDSEAKKTIQTPITPSKPIEPDKIPEKIELPKITESEPIKQQEEPLPKEVVTPLPSPKKIESKKPEQESKLVKPKEMEDKKLRKNESKELDNLLKNLENSSEGDKLKSNKTSQIQKHNPEGNNRSDNFDEELGLTMSEKDLIKRQINDNWHPPLDAEDIEKVKISVHIELSPDGEVTSAKVIDRNCRAVSLSLCKLMTDSALRALKAASPIKGLSAKNYHAWKDFNFNFQKIDDY